MAKYSKEVIETAEGLRLIDDTLFRLVAEDIPACQEIIRELLDDKGLVVIEATPQRRLGGLNRNIIVDLLCKTSEGNYINVEVQTGDQHDDFRRTRLHASIVTSDKTPKSTEFAEVPDVTVIYIAEYDAAKQNLPVVVEHHYIKAGDKLVEVDDGETIVYATTAVKDKSRHTKLLQLFLKDDAFDEGDYGDDDRYRDIEQDMRDYGAADDDYEPIMSHGSQGGGYEGSGSREIPYGGEGLIDYLKSQVYLTKMTKPERHIAKWVLGNIDEDGYLRRTTEQLVDDLAFQESRMKRWRLL